MIKGFFEKQKAHNVNELIRINKISKKVNNYENKKNNLLKKYKNDDLQKKLDDIEKLNDFHNLDNILLVKNCNNAPKNSKLDFLEDVKKAEEYDLNKPIDKPTNLEHLSLIEKYDNTFIKN